MSHVRKLAWVAAALVAAALATGRAHARPRGPIRDMHMHAREAAHYGATKLPLCATVDRMPRWDQRRPLGEDPDAPPLCARPLVSPATDSALLRQTVAATARHNVVGVLGGRPGLVAEWMRAAPGRFIPALDLRFDSDVERRPAFHRFLRGIVEAGYADRVIFGSDSLVWPGLIDAAVRGIEEATYLTAAQRRGIYYDSAARFLRLTPEQVARHHGR